MTPFERVEPRLKGLTNEEVEDVAVRMLAQVFAKHIHIFKDGNEYYKKLQKHLAEETKAYILRNSYELALGSVAHDKNLQSIPPFDKKIIEKPKENDDGRQ